MKHSEKSLPADILAWIFPLLLIIPNIILAFTERDPLFSRLTSIVFPLGIYYIFMALSPKTGRTVLFCLPLMILAAFQIVLLYLYGESIIAIDMFLNVATTNVNEASELLSSLIEAVITVIVIYLPPIILAIVLMARGYTCTNRWRLRIKAISISISATGVIMLIICLTSIRDFDISRNIFPINVISNMIEAVSRSIKTVHYQSTSENYSYEASSTHDENMPELYILVVGETSRADNWQLYGYERPTNPRLSKRNDIVVFTKTLSESNTTHKSVPMLLSPLTSDNFGDSIYYTKGICEAFNEAGFKTAYFSNQQRNHSFIDFFANQAKTTVFIKDNDPAAQDSKLIEEMIEYIENNHDKKTFIILHCYGSHFDYQERYGDEFRVFTPDYTLDASAKNRQELVNAYDNTILFTDAVLDSIICYAESLDIPAVVAYTSDHGEDIYDDNRGRFLHASPTTTFTQIHVPMIFWASTAYLTNFTGLINTLSEHTQIDVSSSSSLFPTILSLAGIESPRINSDLDLSSKTFKKSNRKYLNDYNESVSLSQAGLKDEDANRAKQNNISIN